MSAEWVNGVLYRQGRTAGYAPVGDVAFHVPNETFGFNGDRSVHPDMLPKVGDVVQLWRKGRGHTGPMRTMEVIGIVPDPTGGLSYQTKLIRIG